MSEPGGPVLSASPARRSWAVARLTATSALRSGALWGLGIGIYVAFQSLAYATSYKTLASRQLLVREFGHNPGVSALAGPGYRLDTVPGYTSWKCLSAVAIVAALWGMLGATRATRGDEDAGRWELLLAGATTRAGATLQALTGMLAGWVALVVVTGAVVASVGASSRVGIGTSAAFFFALAATSGAVVFTGVSVLAGQLFATRRQALLATTAVLVASYALRMVADATTGLGWLRWLTPLGWIENARPLTGSHALALLPALGLAGAASVAGILLARSRDLGASLIGERASAPARTALLGGPIRLSIRQLRAVLLGWLVALVAYGLLLGAIAKPGGSIVAASTSLRRAFARLGVSGAEAFLGVSFLIMAVALGFVAIGQLSVLRSEEASGRLDNLLVGPLGRRAWLWRRGLLAWAVLVSGGVVIGLATWVGEASDHAGVGAAVMLESGLNVVSPAVALLGLGILLYGFAPRYAVSVSYVALAWSFMIEIAAGAVSLNHWVADTSPLHQMAPAPAAPIDWTSTAAMAALGVLALAAGAEAFRRRDIFYE